jgi:hypothetical protein
VAPPGGAGGFDQQLVVAKRQPIASAKPAPRTFTYDTRFGRDRIGDNTRLVAGEVADRVMQFWRKHALKQ